MRKHIKTTAAATKKNKCVDCSPEEGDENTGKTREATVEKMLITGYEAVCGGDRPLPCALLFMSLSSRFPHPPAVGELLRGEP